MKPLSVFSGFQKPQICLKKKTRNDSWWLKKLENKHNDHQEAVAGLKVSIGPLSVGGQISGERTGAAATSAVEYYANSSIGVAFNINDSLSIIELILCQGDVKDHLGFPFEFTLVSIEIFSRLSLKYSKCKLVFKI